MNVNNDRDTNQDLSQNNKSNNQDPLTNHNEDFDHDYTIDLNHQSTEEESSDDSVTYVVDWSEDVDGDDFGNIDNLFSAGQITLTRRDGRSAEAADISPLVTRQLKAGVQVRHMAEHEDQERRVNIITDDNPTVKLLTSYDTPPEFDGSGSYSDWKRELKFWKSSTLVPEDKQAGQVLRNLKGQAKDIVMTLEDRDILCKEGIKNMIKAMDKHYKSSQYDRKLRKMSEFLD